MGGWGAVGGGGGESTKPVQQRTKLVENTNQNLILPEKWANDRVTNTGK